MPSMLPRIAFIAAAVATIASAAEPLSRGYVIDFFRDVPSRNLKGLATRSDGRLIAGPLLTDLNGPAVPPLLWCLRPAADGKWLVGTGPDGKIVEVSLNSAGTGYTTREIADLEEPQIFALEQLSDGSILAGTSPNGTLVLVRDGKVVAQATLPVDSIFDLAVRGNRAYAATGNPARIYEVDIAKFARAGLDKQKLQQTAALADKGLRLFGEVRDRNVRRIAWLGDRLVAGSSPKGNVYSFDTAGGAAQILQENRDAEISALLPLPNGDLYAAIVFAAVPGENRINRPAPPKPEGAETPAAPAAAPAERFSGRSSVVYFPRGGYPETVVARANLAFYSLAMKGTVLLIGGGEQGDVLGYDAVSRQNLSFAGSDSAQVSAIAPLAPSGSTKNNAEPSRFLALRNNTPGFAIIDFASSGPRSAETRRMDLGIGAEIGALRVARLRNAAPDNIHVELRGNLGGDEIEGWSPWAAAERRADGWLVRDLRARNVKLKLQINAPVDAPVELDDATLFYLPQNRRPLLSEFRVVSPGFALVPAAEPAPSVVTTLNQLITTTDRDDRRKSSLLNSQVVPAPGMRLVTWNVTDPDGDRVLCTFAISREGTGAWTDIAVNTRDNFAQFESGHFEDGLFLTRIVAREDAPRPVNDRLTVTFDTDDIVIDNTPPEIADIAVSKEGDSLRLRVAGRDALSLLDGAAFVFNDGLHEEVTQPLDGIRDSQSETFVLEIPVSRIAGATSVEVTLFDEPGNRTARRVSLPK
jgi:hypothetical protein